jgi:hypothetical protein
MKPAQAVQLARKVARRHGLMVEDVPGRGKGSHHWYALIDSDGAEVGGFSLTDHPRELSWAVLRSFEDALAPLFGERWTEKK